MRWHARSDRLAWLANAGYYAHAQRVRDEDSHPDDGQVIQRLERARSDESQISSWADSVSALLLVDASDGEWIGSVASRDRSEDEGQASGDGGLSGRSSCQKVAPSA